MRKTNPIPKAALKIAGRIAIKATIPGIKVENGIPFVEKGGQVFIYMGPLATVGDLVKMETKIEKRCKGEWGKQTKVADGGLLGQWLARRLWCKEAKDLFDWSVAS